MVNKVILLGNVGSAVEVKPIGSDNSVANFSLATSEVWYKDGKKEEKTEWHRIVAFGKLADICGKYLDKGSKIFVEGKIQTRQWEDKDGNKRYTTEIVIRELKMLSGNNKSEQKTHQQETAGHDMEEDVPF